MKVLVACEYSGRVRDAFRARGHDAWSCDLLPSDADNAYHLERDMFGIVGRGWDLIIAHPPCTAVCVSGNRHYAGTQARIEGAAFIKKIWQLPHARLCIENPVGVINSLNPNMPRPQYLQPWQFGHGETKKTGLWKRGLPDLIPTNVVEGRADRIHRMPPSKGRWKLRSTTYQGIADAMADQWGAP